MHKLAWFALVFLAGVPTAVADGVITLGVDGPKTREQRATVQRVLESEMAGLAPCFRDPSPKPMRVAMAVAATGKVRSARPVSAGLGTRCAAAVLALAEFPAGPPWQSAVQVYRTTAGESDVSAQLVNVYGKLENCQVDDPKAVGKLKIALVVHPDGRITNVRLLTALTSGIERCLLTTASGLTLPPHRGRPVPYDLEINFRGM